MAPDGCLLLGSAETTLNLDDQFGRTVFGKTTCYSIRPPVR